MKMKLEQLRNDRIAYIRQVGPYGPANARAMQAIKKWAQTKNLLAEPAIIFGIPQDNPATTPPESCRYDACITISREVALNNEVCEGELPGGQYGIFRVKHTAEDIQAAWGDIFVELQSWGYALDDKPILERYSSEMTGEDYCELCVPIHAITDR